MAAEAARKAASEVAAELAAEGIVLNAAMERRVDSKIFDKCGGSEQRDNALLLIMTDSSQPAPLAIDTLRDLCPEFRLLCRLEPLNERIAILAVDHELASRTRGTRKIY
jgi:hypothetical protein